VAHKHWDPEWGDKLLRRYFTDKDGNSRYDQSLAHWVIYIDKHGDVRQQLLKWSSLKGKAIPVERRLNGDSQIWVMAFSEINYASATFSTEQLADYRGPGALVVDAIARSLVGNTIAKAPLSNNAGNQPTPDAADAQTSQALVFHPVGLEVDGRAYDEDAHADDSGSGKALDMTIDGRKLTVSVGESPLKIAMPAKSQQERPGYMPNRLYFASAKSTLNSNTQDRLTVGQFVSNQSSASMSSVTLRNVEANFFNGDAAGF
jgi:hypothetical protein